MAKKHSIHIKKSHEGLLRKQSGTKKGHKIPVKTLTKESHSKNAATRKRAQFALNARKWHHGGK